ncbi:unnamed protein product (macronuclear) [Paramecium tetraurelia]|uniref:Calcium-dependent protein kinase 1 n=1 Tax=Paramecium tetraurelia TaxID=5888 RepID=A0CPJ3_PARTE|nr:uncharacterized protein GSPATT00009102001 [Paramecium tetraurelia]CAK72710.1 unnamed protein product [Paramecium tetraurelia]|eukprot:XP_001440107.1 hypothetical protein (macronuclear) [Paramecium tetraurelia strain d4-2]
MGICKCIAKSAQTPSALSLEFTSYKDAYEGNGGNLRDYKLEDPPLGQGAFGTVWKAVHIASGQLRAIKQINKLKANEDEYQQIINEVNILKSLDHPNIIKIFDYFEENDHLYIVTELCTGGELFDKIIQSNYFSEKEAALAMKQILSALNYCHQSKIVHRDIKPENLLYDHEGEDSQLKIIDFGTSLKYGNQKLEEKIGTVYYMAPELIDEKYDEKCDIWSAGVVLFILLCGSPPFDGETDDQIVKRIQQGNIYFEQQQWKSVSNEAKDLIMQLLNKNPKKRLSANKALLHPWIQKYTSEELEAPELKNVLNNMKHFRTSQKVQEAAFLYIVKQFISKEEKQELQRFFKFLDKNGDGVLTKQELLEGYKKVISQSEAELQVEQIMKQVDKNESGLIDYSEFVAATINKQKLLQQDILEQAFKAIDNDNNGAITVEELKHMFGAGNKIPSETWTKLMEEVDKNGDGVLSLQEFKEMMLKLQID